MKIKITCDQKQFLVEAAEFFLKHPEECGTYFCHYIDSEAVREGFEKRKMDKIIRIVADKWKHSLRKRDGEVKYAFIPDDDSVPGMEGDPSHPMRRKFVKFFLKHIRATKPKKK